MAGQEFSQELMRRLTLLERRFENFLSDTEVGLGLNKANFTAFSRVRTAATGNRSDVEFIYDKQPLLFDDISSGTGTATHQVNPRDVLLAVGGTGSGATGGMRQHYWVPYTAGDGQFIFNTGTADNAAIGGGTMYAFLRSTISGTTTLLENTAQTSWNINTASDVDWSKSQIFGIDFQSLKVGRIRFYLDRDGDAVRVHEVYNDNVRSSGYWQSPSLPPYWKLHNDETNTIFEIGYGDELNGVGFRYVYDGLQSTATALAICETVKSEGGVGLFDMPGLPNTISNETTAVTVSTTLVPVLSIRVAATFNSLTNRMVIIPTDYGIQADNAILYKIIYRPTLTGASWTAVDSTYSGMEYDISASAISGGVEIAQGYLTSGNVNRAAVDSGNLLGRVIMALGSSGTSDILTIAAIKTATSDADTYAYIDWKEIR